MNFFLFLINLILSLVLSSCINIASSALSETPGLHSGYKNLSKEDKKNIIVLQENQKISEINSKDKICAIQAKHLLNYIAEHDSCLVYFWSPHCSSKTCISPIACQQYCDENNYQLIMIAEYYTFPEMHSIIPLINNPLFTINSEYYKTDYCNKYRKKFEKELLKNAEHKPQKYGRYWFFVNGRFQRDEIELF